MVLHLINTLLRNLSLYEYPILHDGTFSNSSIPLEWLKVYTVCFSIRSLHPPFSLGTASPGNPLQPFPQFWPRISEVAGQNSEIFYWLGLTRRPHNY